MALVLASACTFDGSAASSVSTAPDEADAATTTVVAADSGAAVADDGASVLPDAAQPMWAVVETLLVDTANPQPTVSQLSLQSGVEYRLRVSGTITNVIGNSSGDADWWDFGAPKDHGCCEDIGLGIDDLVVDDMDTKPDWGPYDESHVYQVQWTGDGTTIAALYQDTYYGNNIGSLTLEILAYE